MEKCDARKNKEETEKIRKTLKNFKGLSKNEKGITLVALVVTIIILIILAGVSISLVLGENGILQKARDAKTQTDEEQIKERIKLAYHSALAEGEGSYTKDTLEKELTNEFGEEFEEVDDSSDTNWILKAKGQSVTILAGIVEQIEDTTWQKAFEFPSYNWNNYILDENNKTLTLRSGAPFMGTENIEVKGYAIINGVKYDTKFPNSCSGLFNADITKNITISDVDTSNVTDMSHMFSFCKNLESVTISKIDTSNVTNMSEMFGGLENLKSVSLSNLNTSNVTDMNGMFNSCRKLESLDLSSLDTSKVTNMSGMFAMSFVNDDRPGALNTIYVSNSFVVNTVSSSSNMFTGCTSLVGGNGTTYDSSKTDKTYAHIDGGTSNPGYFTAK